MFRAELSRNISSQDFNFLIPKFTSKYELDSENIREIQLTYLIRLKIP